MSGVEGQIGRVQQRITRIEQRLQQIDARFAAQADFQATLRTAGTASAPVYPEIDGYIRQAADRYNLRPELLRAVVQAESGGNARAVSPKGAMGLMQLMPGLANSMGVSDPYDPEQNIMAGAQYLRQQMDAFNGDERLALAAYNAGPGAVRRYGGIPPYTETLGYVSRVMTAAGSDE